MPSPCSRRRFLLCTAAAPLIAQTPRASQPNVLLIVTADVGAWMLGCYGNREIQTPNIDKLARGGLRFTAGFTSSPASPAARATLFTGRTPMQLGIDDSLAGNPSALQNETLLSDILARHGYRCGYVGRWDLGSGATPQHHFDYWHPDADGGEKGYQAERVTQQANGFLAEQQAGKPFFLVAGYPGMQTAQAGLPQKYTDRYAAAKFDTVGWDPAAATAARNREYLRDIVPSIRKAAAAVTAVDDQIPPLLAALEQRGLRDNTLILIVSDTGTLLGRHGLWGDGLSSDPINMYEEVVRIPIIFNWRGRVPVEATRPELVSLYDVVPTLCDALNVEQPTGNVCGRSFLPILTGGAMPKKEPWRNLAFVHCRNTDMARDTRYKLVSRNGGKGPNELYDVRVDTREKVNQYANPQFLTVRDRLARALDSWRSRYSH